MPELGEVEFARHQFQLYGLNSEITSVSTRNDKDEYDTIVCDCAEDELNDCLRIGNKITTSNRKGKQLYFDIVNKKKSKVKSLLIHFGMTGTLVWKDKDIPEYKSFTIDKNWPPRFCKCLITFKNGNSVAYCDPRRIGRVRLRDDPLTEEPISKLAPDPSIQGIGNRDDLILKMSKISSPIKAVLLDQEKLFCGIGNWLADEVLFHAGLHPETFTKNIIGNKLDNLLNSIKFVIDTAVVCCVGQTSFPENFLFHHRWDKKITKLPTGEAIKHIKIGGRTSVFVPSMQKLCTSSKDENNESSENKKRKLDTFEPSSSSDKKTNVKKANKKRK